MDRIGDNQDELWDEEDGYTVESALNGWTSTSVCYNGVSKNS